jgi:hypothetical protein
VIDVAPVETVPAQANTQNQDYYNNDYNYDGYNNNDNFNNYNNQGYDYGNQYNDYNQYQNNDYQFQEEYNYANDYRATTGNVAQNEADDDLEAFLAAKKAEEQRQTDMYRNPSVPVREAASTYAKKQVSQPEPPKPAPVLNPLPERPATNMMAAAMN